MNTQEFLTQAKTLSLSPGEKVTVREALLRAMDEPQPGFSMLRIFSLRSIGTLTAAILLLSAGGTTLSALAEDALPGDLLYPVKTQLNERIQIAFARGRSAKAELSLIQAERRLLEAETLAARASLTAETEGQLTVAFDRHVRSLESNLTAADQGKAEDIAGIRRRFKTALLAHSSLLVALDGRSATASKRTEENDSLSRSIQVALLDNEEHVMAASDASVAVSLGAATATDDTSLAAAAESIAAINKQIARKSKVLPTGTRTYVNGKISAAATAMEAANILRDDPVRARPLVRAALKNAKEAAIGLSLEALTPLPPVAASGDTTDAVMSDIQEEIKLSKQARLRRTGKEREQNTATLAAPRALQDVSAPVASPPPPAAAMSSSTEITVEEALEADAEDAQAIETLRTAKEALLRAEQENADSDDRGGE